MLFFQEVEGNLHLNRSSPLWLGHFYGDLTRMTWAKRKERQKIIISIALAWRASIRSNEKAPGFIAEEMFLTQLTRRVRDCKQVVEKFFIIDRLGFNTSAAKSPTKVRPRRLDNTMITAIDALSHGIVYDPGLQPTDKNLTQSEVSVSFCFDSIARMLQQRDRQDLLPIVKWLDAHQGNINFYFRPSGQLKQRDTSVWPINAIETWPKWLREEIFPGIIDIENAFCQFIVRNLERKYSQSRNTLELKYPTLLELNYNKTQFRRKLCEDVLKMPLTIDNIKIVKQLIMSLANGSNASPQMMVSASTRSEAVKIVQRNCKHLNTADLLDAGKQLQQIARQFRSAKRSLSRYLLDGKPGTRKPKETFAVYLKWEREFRYKIWEQIGRKGIMMHDGLDGIGSIDVDTIIQQIEQQLDIKVSATK